MTIFAQLSWLAVLSMIALPVAAQAPDVIKPGEERVTVVLGVFLPAFNTDLRIDDPALGRGTALNLRDDFGFDRRESGLWTGAEWRFLPRHRLGLSYSRFKSSGTRTATRDIQVGDEILPAGAVLSADLRVDMMPITYSYSFIKRDRHELAGIVGVHWSRLDFKAEGSVSLEGMDATADATAEADVPLPLIGLRYDHHFSQPWSAGMRAGLFSVRYGGKSSDAEGKLWAARVHAEYRFTRNLGMGAAIDALKVNVEAKAKSWQGEINYRYWGPQLYLQARF